MDCRIPGFHVLQNLWEFAQIHVLWVCDVIIISSSVTPFSFCLQSFPASGSFPTSQLFESGGQSIGASASVLPMNIQGLFLLGLTGLIFSLSQGLSRVFSNTTVQKHQFFGTQPSCPTLTSIRDSWKHHSFDYMDLCRQSDVSVFNVLSMFVIAFLPRNKCLLISWLQSPSTVILEPKKIKFVTVSIVMKWWDGMARCSLFVCWVLSPLFHSPLSPSSRGSLLLFAFFH